MRNISLINNHNFLSGFIEQLELVSSLNEAKIYQILRLAKLNCFAAKEGDARAENFTENEGSAADEGEFRKTAAVSIFNRPRRINNVFRRFGGVLLNWTDGIHTFLNYTNSIADLRIEKLEGIGDKCYNPAAEAAGAIIEDERLARRDEGRLVEQYGK